MVVGIWRDSDVLREWSKIAAFSVRLPDRAETNFVFTLRKTNVFDTRRRII